MYLLYKYLGNNCRKNNDFLLNRLRIRQLIAIKSYIIFLCSRITMEIVIAVKMKFYLMELEIAYHDIFVSPWLLIWQGRNFTCLL